MARRKLTPLELQQLKMAGELDPSELQKAKIAAYQARGGPRPQAQRRRMEDPIEAKKRKMAEAAARRRQAQRPLPRHLVVVVRKLHIPPTRRHPKKPQAAPEDEIARRMAQAKRKLGG